MLFLWLSDVQVYIQDMYRVAASNLIAVAESKIYYLGTLYSG
jgi:hypothetical protein